MPNHEGDKHCVSVTANPEVLAMRRLIAFFIVYWQIPKHIHVRRLTNTLRVVLVLYVILCSYVQSGPCRNMKEKYYCVLFTGNPTVLAMYRLMAYFFWCIGKFQSTFVCCVLTNALRVVPFCLVVLLNFYSVACLVEFLFIDCVITDISWRAFLCTPYSVFYFCCLCWLAWESGISLGASY